MGRGGEKEEEEAGTEASKDLIAATGQRGEGGKGGYLDHLMGIGRLHGFPPLKNDVSPREPENDVTSDQIPSDIKGFG